MNNTGIEFKASTVEEAIEKGLKELGKNKEEVSIDIVDVGGFLKKAKVLITINLSEREKAEDFLKTLLGKMDFEIDVETEETEEKINLNLSGKDSGKIIGYRGDVLDAVQYITSIAVNKEQDSGKKIYVDCESYRRKREETLISLAGRLADKAVERGRKVSLEPMNPFERRIIHSALQNNEAVKTESEGTEPNRHIVITPNNYTGGTDDEGRRSYSDRGGRGRPFNRDRNGGRDNREDRGGDRGGRDSRGGRREGGDRQRSGFGGSGRSKSSSAGGFGTYLGNSKSGFGMDNSFEKKSKFDSLKD